MVDLPRRKSPRAPSMALEEAMNRALKIYGQERLHTIPINIAAQGAGYKNANSGAALQALASLRYYGLVNRISDGQIAVAKSVEEYQFSPEQTHRQQILRNWIASPPIFSDLLTRYASGLPSDATLRFDLIQQGFSPISAESTISAFRKSVEFVGYFELGDDKKIPDLSDVDNVVHVQQVDKPQRKQVNPLIVDVASSKPNIPDGLQLDKIPVRLSGGRRAWLMIPVPFFVADKSRLIAQIEFLLTQEDEN